MFIMVYNRLRARAMGEWGKVATEVSFKGDKEKYICQVKHTYLLKHSLFLYSENIC